MKYVYKFLKAFGSNKPGDVLDFEETEAEALVTQGILEKQINPVQEACTEILGDVQTSIKRAIAEQIKAATEEVRKANKATPGLHVSDPEIDPRGGFKTIGHFCSHVAKASGGRGATKELAEYVQKTAGHMSEGDLAQGGYLVPAEFRAELFKKMMEATVVRPRATLIPMNTNVMYIPYIDETSRASTLHGGIAINQTSEAEEKTASKPTFDRVTLTLSKLTGLVYVSDELLEDNPLALEAVITAAFRESVAFEADALYLTGAGTTEPMGVISAPATITVNRTTAGAISGEDVINMWARLHAPSMANAVWVANQSTFPELATMTIPTGTGVAPVWLPAGGLSASPYQTLFGRPLLYSEKVPALGTTGDLGLYDFSQYLIGQKGGGDVQFASSMHVRFVYDEQTFRFVLRHDGQPWWATPLQPRNGDTVSPFVILGEEESSSSQ